MKFENYRRRQLLSSFGFIKYEQAYYYCGVCRRAVCRWTSSWN